MAYPLKINADDATNWPSMTMGGVTYKRAPTGQWYKADVTGDKTGSGFTGTMINQVMDDSITTTLNGMYQNRLSGSGAGGLSSEELQNLTQNQMTQQQVESNFNRSTLEGLQKEYDSIPETLKASYLAAAQKAGTYGNTDEFNAGLSSEVAAGTRGAQEVMLTRINAMRQQLGLPLIGGATPPPTLEGWTPGAHRPTTNNVSNTADSVAKPSERPSDNSPVSAPTSTATRPTSAEQQNAVTSLARPKPTTSTKLRSTALRSRLDADNDSNSTTRY